MVFFIKIGGVMEQYWVLNISDTDWDEDESFNDNSIYFKIPCNISYDYLYKIISSIAYSYNKISRKYVNYTCRRGGSISYPNFLSIVKPVIKKYFEMDEVNNAVIKNISENTIKTIKIDDIQDYLRTYHNNEYYYCTEIYNKKIVYNRITNSQIFYDNNYIDYFNFDESDDEQYRSYYKRTMKQFFYDKQVAMDHVLFDIEEIKDELSIDYYPDDKEIDKVVAIILKKRLNKIGKEEEQEEYEY